MYCMIENVGEAPIEAFQIMGVSTTRGSEGTIGTFGSGTKYAICCLLREGHEVIIYSGEDKLEFFARPKTINDGLTVIEFKQLFCKVNGVEHSLNIVLEHGVSDWTDPEMGFREFIANALDRTYRQRGNYDIEFRPERVPEGRAGWTRVYISWSNALARYIEKIDSYFLHFSRKQNVRVLRKGEPSPVKFYKNGVLVGIDEKKNSIYDYNLPDFKLTESRILHPQGTFSAVALEFINSRELTRELLRLIADKQMIYETSEPHHFRQCWQFAKETWFEMFGTSVPYSDFDDLKLIAQHNRGGVTILGTWIEVLQSNGIETAKQLKHKRDLKNRRATESEILNRLHVMCSPTSYRETKPNLVIGETTRLDGETIIIHSGLVGCDDFDKKVVELGLEYYFDYNAEKRADLIWRFIRGVES